MRAKKFKRHGGRRIASHVRSTHKAKAAGSVVHDPFVADLERALRTRRLDPVLFQKCANAMLIKRFPGISPLAGANDAGMDGAIADGEGTPFPLIVTTAKDVRRNLRGSLSEYASRGEGRTKVALATSRTLDPPERRALHEIARDRGFTIEDIIDGPTFAQLLAHEPEWALALLGVHARPAAISRWPISSRPLLGQLAIGRAEDLSWVQSQTNDCVVVGQPGCGKTFLLVTLARAQGCWFVVSSDFDAIATDLRRLEGGQVLVVDDAHAHLELLARLVQDRRARGTSFRIVATTWPGERDAVAQALGVPSIATRELALLTRTQIVEVLHQCDLGGPRELVAELVHQANGLPGRAASLADLCLRSDVRVVLRGEALATQLRVALKRLVAPRAYQCLAGFGLGGRDGVAQPTVAAALGLSVAEVQDMCTHLLAGGFLAETRRGSMAVWPDRLRHAVVREVFFPAHGALDATPILAAAHEVRSVATTLVHVRLLGGAIGDELLDSFVERAASRRVWSLYACIGVHHARRALMAFPRVLESIAPPVLDLFPDVWVPALLEKAVGDLRDLGPHPSHPMRLLQDWIKSAVPGTADSLAHRRVLLDHALRWLRSGKDDLVGAKAIELAFCANHERHETSIDDSTTTLFFGMLPATEIQRMGAWWTEISDVVLTLSGPATDPLCKLARHWAYPYAPMGSVPADCRDAMREVSRRMLTTLAERVREHPARLRQVLELAEVVELEIPAQLDPEFEALYPRYDPDEGVVRHVRVREDGQALAARWALEEPTDCARRIAGLVSAFEAVQGHGLRGDHSAVGELARIVANPLTWGQAFRQAGLCASFLAPFAFRAAVLGQAGWEDFVLRMCDLPGGRSVAAHVLVGLASPPVRLLEGVFTSGSGLGRTIEFPGVDGVIPPMTAAWLLRHDDDEIVEGAVLYEWHAAIDGNVRAEISREWRAAVPRARHATHWLNEILGTDAELAEAWLRRWMADARQQRRADTTVVVRAVQTIALPVRRALLRDVDAEDSGTVWVLVKELVGQDSESFRDLLARADLDYVHLRPLEDAFDPPGLALVALALDAGNSPDEVANAMQGSGHTISGPESPYWESWIARFEALLTHPDPRLHEVARAGAGRMRARMSRAQREEHDEAVHGFRSTGHMLDD